MSADLSAFQGRLLPARPDLAAEHLRGRVSAARYAPGIPLRVRAPLLDLFATAAPGAELATQLLHGETFVVYETTSNGRAWGQARLDGYVGYVDATRLGPAQGTGRRVTALWSQIYRRPEIRGQVETDLPFGAELSAKGSTGVFTRLRDGGFVPSPHLVPFAGDFVAAAERFVGVPYLWGGRSARGLDCSALVQLALLATGQTAPRDSDMQAALLGLPLDARATPARGDLVFWKGHVGVLTDAETLLHANAHHMAVTAEPLTRAISRIAAAGGGPVLIRRRMGPTNASAWRPNT